MWLVRDEPRGDEGWSYWHHVAFLSALFQFRDNNVTTGCTGALERLPRALPVWYCLGIGQIVHGAVTGTGFRQDCSVRARSSWVGS